jgi:hypothetical protein
VGSGGVVDSDGRRREAVSKEVGEHHDEVAARFDVPGRRGAHWSSAPHGGAVDEGGSPVRGHRRGRGQSLHGRRGASGRGGAHGGEDEAGRGPEWPARGGVPDDGRRRRPLVAALRGGCSSALLV